jgi:mono/diheme cytochrome c family protein
MLLLTAFLLQAARGWAQDLESGRKQFESRCAGCHGSDAVAVSTPPISSAAPGGEGGTAINPDLKQAKYSVTISIE